MLIAGMARRIEFGSDGGRSGFCRLRRFQVVEFGKDLGTVASGIHAGVYLRDLAIGIDEERVAG